MSKTQFTILCLVVLAGLWITREQPTVGHGVAHPESRWTVVMVPSTSASYHAILCDTVTGRVWQASGNSGRFISMTGPASAADGEDQPAQKK